MEPFEIQLLEDHFRIESLENEPYRIMDGKNKLGFISRFFEINRDCGLSGCSPGLLC